MGGCDDALEGQSSSELFHDMSLHQLILKPIVCFLCLFTFLTPQSARLFAVCNVALKVAASALGPFVDVICLFVCLCCVP